MQWQRSQLTNACVANRFSVQLPQPAPDRTRTDSQPHTMQAAHQLRLQQLLESGRLTPAPSPPPTEEAATKAAAAAAAAPPAATKGKKGKGKKRALASTLASVAESQPQHLPDSIDYIVAVSTRTSDVSLENDHDCQWPSETTLAAAATHNARCRGV